MDNITFSVCLTIVVNSKRTYSSHSPPPLVWVGEAPGPRVHNGLQHLHQDLGMVPELVLQVVLGEHLLLVNQKELDSLALQLRGLVDLSQDQDVDDLKMILGTNVQNIQM